MVDVTKQIEDEKALKEKLAKIRVEIKDEGERLSKVYVNHENMINARVNALVDAESQLKNRQLTVQAELKEIADREASVTEKQSKIADDLNRIEIIRKNNNAKLDAIDKKEKALGELEIDIDARNTKTTADGLAATDKLSKVNHIIVTIQDMIKGV